MRKHYSATFKAEMVKALLKEEKTLSQLGQAGTRCQSELQSLLGLLRDVAQVVVPADQCLLQAPDLCHMAHELGLGRVCMQNLRQVLSSDSVLETGH